MFLKVAIPSVSEDSVVSKWSELDGGRGSQTSGGGSKAIERVKNRDYDGSLYMVNKPPRWNDQVRVQHVTHVKVNYMQYATGRSYYKEFKRQLEFRTKKMEESGFSNAIERVNNRIYDSLPPCDQQAFPLE